MSRPGCQGQDGDPESRVTRESSQSTFLSTTASRGKPGPYVPTPFPGAAALAAPQENPGILTSEGRMGWPQAAHLGA